MDEDNIIDEILNNKFILEENARKTELDDLKKIIKNLELDDIKKIINIITNKIYEIPEDNKYRKNEYLQRTLDTISIDLDKLLSEQKIELELENLKSIIPKNYIRPNNKFCNEITKNLVNNNKINGLNMGKKNGNKKIPTYIKLTYKTPEDKIPVLDNSNFTPYDRIVSDGVATLIEAGNNIITTPMIYRAMNGMTKNEKVSKSSIKKIDKSMNKMNNIIAKIDWSEEIRIYKKDIKELTFEGRLLQFDKAYINAGGNKVTAYKMFRKPLLYEHSQISGQVINIPSDVLNTNKVINNTDDIKIIRAYLLGEIEQMKHPKNNRNNKIAYEGVYAELGIIKNRNEEGEKIKAISLLDPKAFKEKRLTIRNNIKKIFSYWININYIKYFEEYKEGRTFKGIVIKC